MKSVSQRLTAALLVSLTSFAGCGSGRVVLPFTIDPAVMIAPHETTTARPRTVSVRPSEVCATTPRARPPSTRIRVTRAPVNSSAPARSASGM